MKAFEVFVNGKRACVAGVGGKGGLSMQISWLVSQDNGHILVCGLDRLKYSLKWINSDLSLGDEVTIRLTEATEVDRPIESRPHGDSPPGANRF